MDSCLRRNDKVPKYRRKARVRNRFLSSALQYYLALTGCRFGGVFVLS